MYNAESPTPMYYISTPSKALAKLPTPKSVV